jgi:molybdopterin-guanine dinucleotide biosynthesis protein A
MRTGIVLAGGRSTRFGDRDKAVGDLAGTPMIRWVADRLTGVVDAVVVNCRAGQRDPIEDAMAGYPLEVKYAVDETPDLGPMAGIRNGLRAVESRYGFVVACDMPFVDPDLVAFLFDRVEGHEAAVPRVGGEWFQTTQAVYRADAMARACDRALERGDRKIIEPLFELDYLVVEEAELEEYASLSSFDNVNTREEFEEAVERIEGGE